MGPVGEPARAMLRGMAADAPRTYRFSITVTVEAGDPAFGDPEWVADAAAGALANVHGYECFFDNVVEVEYSR
jgi:hypothetical protein